MAVDDYSGESLCRACFCGNNGANAAAAFWKSRRMVCGVGNGGVLLYGIGLPFPAGVWGGIQYLQFYCAEYGVACSGVFGGSSFLLVCQKEKRMR